MSTSTTKTATTRDRCAYVYRQPKLTRCAKTREEHSRVQGLSHGFVDADAQPPEHDAGLRDDAQPQFQVGQRVYWNDPDDGICSGYGTVTCIGDMAVSLEMDGGGETEVLRHELSAAPSQPATGQVIAKRKDARQ